MKTWQKGLIAFAILWFVAANVLLIVLGVKVFHKHGWNLAESQPAFCERSGYSRFACSCGEEKIVLVESLGHDFLIYAERKPDCKSVGWAEYKKCRRTGGHNGRQWVCEYSTYEEIPALSHEFDESGICILCHTVQGQENGHIHDFKEGATLRKATCSQKGLQEFICDCGEKEVTEITGTHYYVADICEYCNQGKPSLNTSPPSPSTPSTQPGDSSDTPSQGEDDQPTPSESDLRFLLQGDGYICEGFIAGKEKAFLEIPSEYDGKPVTGVGESAFAGNDEIVRVTLGENVQTIGANAFSDCDNLVELYNLTGRTFAGLDNNVKFVHTDKNQASNIIEYGDGYMGATFDYQGTQETVLIGYDRNKAEVKIPDGITLLKPRVFKNNLQKIDTGNTVRVICSNTFDRLTNLKEVVIGEGVKSIQAKAFNEMTCVESVTFEKTDNWCVYLDEEKTQWYPLEIDGKTAEKCAKYLTVGTLGCWDLEWIYVEG